MKTTYCKQYDKDSEISQSANYYKINSSVSS